MVYRFVLTDLSAYKSGQPFIRFMNIKPYLRNVPSGIRNESLTFYMLSDGIFNFPMNLDEEMPHNNLYNVQKAQPIPLSSATNLQQ